MGWFKDFKARTVRRYNQKGLVDAVTYGTTKVLKGMCNAPNAILEGFGDALRREEEELPKIVCLECGVEISTGHLCEKCIQRLAEKNKES